MQLRSGAVVAAVQAGTCGSDSTLGLGTSMCLRCGRKKKKKVLKGDQEQAGVTVERFEEIKKEAVDFSE